MIDEVVTRQDDRHMIDDVVRGKMIDGHDLSRAIDRGTAEQAAALIAQDIVPTLAVVHVGESAAADSYRRQIARQARNVCIAVRDVPLPEGADAADLDRALTALNEDQTVHGVLVQTPLSSGLRRVVLHRLSSDKDPEG